MVPPVPSTISIGEPQFALSPMLYSLFFETEINFGGEGGVYAELLVNRDFETLGRGRIPGSAENVSNLAAPPSPLDPRDVSNLAAPPSPLDPREPVANSSDFSPWGSLGGATISMDNTTAPFATNPNSLKIVAAPGALGGVGATNPGYWGIAVRPSIQYRLTLYAKASTASAALRLSAKLTTAAGATTLAVADLQPAPPDPTAPATAPGWGRFTATLKPTTSTVQIGALEIFQADGRLQDGASTYWLDGLSLLPSDAVGGLFRRDAFERLRDLKPGFMRTPGGNYLEGSGMRTRWNWKATLGAAASRSGHYNSAWGYWVTDGLGIFELLTMCELLNSTCQMSVYTGYSMGRSYIPMNESEPFAVDAVDMIDFANADAHASEYAAVRAKMGHPKPFGLQRVEVGNEESNMSPDDGYAPHYRLITQRLWAKFPALTIVASGRWGPSVVGSPCLTGQRCDVWDDHYYRTPDAMAALGSVYDDYNRSLPRVFVGEFAANTGHHRTLRAALAEGIFMVGFERNADVVESSSFAPLCNNVKGTQWEYNLVNFNGSHLFVLPSYHAQRMLSGALGAHTLETTLSPPYDAMGGRRPQDAPAVYWIATASIGGVSASTLVIKMVNYGPQARAVDVAWGGTRPMATVTSARVLTADTPDAQNTLDHPEAVIPANLAPAPSVEGGGTRMKLEVPPWSLVVVEVTLATKAPQ